MGGPFELQRLTPLICTGDDGVEVVLWDVNDLATRHKISFKLHYITKGSPPVTEAAAGQAPEPSRPSNGRDDDLSLAPPRCLVLPL